jgi:predicted nicotinamide N-methyase
MQSQNSHQQMLSTTTGEFPLHDYRFGSGGREWSILHVGAMLTTEDEQRFLRELRERLPYGVALWPASIALAHDLAGRAEALRGGRLLELGAGTGLPGIVAAALGAQVLQTDGHAVAMHLCRRNGQRNHARAIEYRQADWASWGDEARYEWIVGADILYGEALHPQLRAIFERNLAPGGRVLLADPFREPSLKLLGALEGSGWAITLSKWSVGEEAAPRSVGIYELTPPR